MAHSKTLSTSLILESIDVIRKMVLHCHVRTFMRPESFVDLLTTAITPQGDIKKSRDSACVIGAFASWQYKFISCICSPIAFTKFPRSISRSSEYHIMLCVVD